MFFGESAFGYYLYFLISLPPSVIWKFPSDLFAKIEYTWRTKVQLVLLLNGYTKLVTLVAHGLLGLVGLG